MEILVNAFVVLFIVVDPVGLTWVFAALTQGVDAAARPRMAVRGVAIATVMLTLFFFAGDRLLGALGITLPAFRIAGGVLLFLIAIDMVFARHSGLRSATAAERAEAAGREDLSLFPMAFPLLAGPGALTTVMLMASGGHPTWVFWGLFGVLLAVMACTLGALLVTARLAAALGETGANMVSRLLGLILAALAVQYVLDGLIEGLGLGAV